MRYFLFIFFLSFVSSSYAADNDSVQVEQVVLPPTKKPVIDKNISDLLAKPDTNPVIWREGSVHPNDRIQIVLTGASVVQLTVQLDANGDVELLFLSNSKQNFLNLTPVEIINKIKQALTKEGWANYTVNITKLVEQNY